MPRLMETAIRKEHEMKVPKSKAPAEMWAEKAGADAVNVTK